LTVAGDYGFRLTVTDNDGATDSGTIIVRVNPAFVPPVVDVDVNLDVVSQGSSVGIVVDIDNLSALNLSCTLQGPGNIQDGGSPISNPFSVLAGTNFTRTFTAGPLNSASVYTLTCNDGVNPAYIDADTVEVVPKIQEI
jgi:hypothetical protein